ncbi:MAG TPA: hypothetical protein VHY80_21645 [Stellaceae bacterium]|nr:hypothetical protein [Stellaceae bacterium]
MFYSLLLKRVSARLTLLIPALFAAGWPLAAAAHVKWFAAYDVPGQPRLLSEVFKIVFWQPASAALLAFVLTSYLERHRLGAGILAALDRLTGWLRPRVDDLYRAGTAAFFVALWTIGGIILTPELKTQSPYIPLLQVAIAAGMFWRPTMVLSALGIVALYAIGLANYGLFHMLDYPIFLGLAAYLACSGLKIEPFGVRPLDIARWAAGLTLMWASVEKWAYPEWTYPLFKSNPSLAMGFYVDYYMSAAGIVEFSLSLGLLWTPLVRRLSALVLIAMFTTAIVPFGKVDAIGHSMIIVILIGILVDREPTVRRPPISAMAYYPAALAATISLYYGVHALIYGTMIW